MIIENQLTNTWSVKNVYPTELVSAVLAEDYTRYDLTWFGNDQYHQKNQNRKRINFGNDSVYAELNQVAQSYIPEISELVQKNIKGCFTAVWVDGPGYIAARHLDNSGVNVAMQVYLNDGPYSLGTAFGDAKGQVQYQFPYVSNTGYIMNNYAGAYHWMTNAVPEDFLRFCTYTWYAE